MENNLKLPLDVKWKWINALRSGEYTQSTGSLKNVKGYCCLGVLARVCEYTDENLLGYGFLHRDIFPNVPVVVMGSKDNTVARTVSTMNDTGRSFIEIADWIEQNL